MQVTTQSKMSAVSRKRAKEKLPYNNHSREGGSSRHESYSNSKRSEPYDARLNSSIGRMQRSAIPVPVQNSRVPVKAENEDSTAEDEDEDADDYEYSDDYEEDFEEDFDESASESNSNNYSASYGGNSSSAVSHSYKNKMLNLEMQQVKQSINEENVFRAEGKDAKAAARKLSSKEKSSESRKPDSLNRSFINFSAARATELVQNCFRS